MNRPHRPLRVAAATLIIGLLALLAAVALTVRVSGRIESVGTPVQALESAVKDRVFVGVAVWFLATVETRLKRRERWVTLRP